MRVRYIFSFPYSVDAGGGNQIVRDITNTLRHSLIDVKVLDYENIEVDFDILIVFGCTYVNIEMLELYKKRNVKVVVYPIFDRMQPVWKLKLFKSLMYLPILNVYSLRVKLFSLADLIIVANNSEKRDLTQIYKVPQSRMIVLIQRLSDSFFEMTKSVTHDLFFEKYKIKDFVFCPAARISKRKNQMSLIKALTGTDIQLVINNTQNLDDTIKDEFKQLIQTNPNVLCLESLDRKMLISCYQNAKVSVSVSQAETAGLVNLEAGYLGCNLVVSDLEALHEYLGEYTIYCDQNNLKSIKEAVVKQINEPKNEELPKYIQKTFTWDSYIRVLIGLIDAI